MTSVLTPQHWLDRAEHCEFDGLAETYREVARALTPPVEANEVLSRSAVLVEVARDEDEPERSALLATAGALVATLRRVLR
ncbi:hypothetical protein KVF89_16320 [Nocardioides carbamazepini]|uniref:hypothetical protein n=1 Tax=Nocardioides carbamazepini TaxID=2854259 RepID=UPI002149A710|nr:hypothetical protein [Nocardioides carbamazepini]MCR1784106.1 hypothetical protein [Nocardioides carbamazepini]